MVLAGRHSVPLHYHCSQGEGEGAGEVETVVVLLHTGTDISSHSASWSRGQCLHYFDNRNVEIVCFTLADGQVKRVETGFHGTTSNLRMKFFLRRNDM